MGRALDRVLVVDDDPFMRRLLGVQLRQIGCHEVHAVEGGSQALDWLAEAPAPPDAIVLDLHMPGLDGLAVVAQLAQRRFGGAVLLLSGDDDAALQAAVAQARALLPGVRAALRKPVPPQALAAALG